jgi:hypothetical protein
MPLPRQKNTSLAGFQIHTTDCLSDRIYTGQMGGLGDDDLRCSKQHQFSILFLSRMCLPLLVEIDPSPASSF